MADTTTNVVVESVPRWKFWRRHRPIAHERMKWWTKWDSPLYAMVIFIGVPLLGWTVHDLCWSIAIAFAWVTLSTVFYFWFEGREMLNQINEFGVLDQQQSDRQRRSMQWLYWGIAGVVVIYMLFAAIWLFMAFASWNGMFQIPGPVWYGPRSWFVELLLVVHTGLVGYLSIDIIYALISRFQEALANQRRREERVPS